MKEYTLGFIFDKTKEEVLLMHKNRPDWQAGKINGIGGKIEDGEEALDCIARETEEETGLAIPQDQWVAAGIMRGETWQINVFTTIYNGDKSNAQTMEDEPIEWFDVNKLPSNVIPNLHWLVPITLDKLSRRDIDSFLVNFNDRNPT